MTRNPHHHYHKALHNLDTLIDTTKGQLAIFVELAEGPWNRVIDDDWKADLESMTLLQRKVKRILLKRELNREFSRATRR